MWPTRLTAQRPSHSARICKHDDLIDLVRLQQLEHIGQCQITFACPGGAMKHGDFIAGKTIKGQFLVNIAILGLNGIEHECLERLILDRNMLIAIPAEHIGYIVICITQDQILVCQQAEDIRGWVIIQFCMFLLSRHNLFVAGICICWQDVGSAAHIQVKNIVGDELWMNS